MATLREHRVQSGILFTLRIHTRGTSTACEWDPRSKKDERKNVRIIHSGRPVSAFTRRCLIDRPAQKQKNRQEQSETARVSAKEED